MKSRFHFILPFLLATAAPSFAAGPVYTLTEVPDFGYGSDALGINDAGQIVGSVSFADGSYHGALWNPGQGVTDLGALPGQSLTVALSINDSGEVIGNMDASGGELRGGFIWQAGSGMVALAANGLATQPRYVNDAGLIAGVASSDNFTGSAFGFVATSAAAVAPLSIDGMVVSDVLAINGNGQMAISTASDSNSLFYTPGQAPIGIEGPGLTQATALAMNDSGAVVGNATADGAPIAHAFLWTQSGGMVDLTPGENAFGMANAINAAGEVVGVQGIAFQSQNAFLYDNGTMYDLDPLLGGSAAGWSSLVPQGINDSGVIVGVAQYNGLPEAFELTPTVSPSEVPEPASLGVLALGAFGLFQRRRRAARA